MQANRKSAGRTIDSFDVLPPEPDMRCRSNQMTRPIMVEDAVFEVISPVRTRQQFNDNPAPKTLEHRIELTKLAAVAGVFVINGLEKMLSRLSTQSFMTLLASLFFLVFWFFGGFNALATQPVEKPEPAFAVEKVFFETQDANGMRLVAVGGTLVNRTGKAAVAPALSVANKAGDLIGTIRVGTGMMKPGSDVRFAARFNLAGGKSGAISIFPQTR